MDQNTAMAIVLGALFGGIALVCAVGLAALAVVERAKERTKQLRIERGGESE